MVTSVEGSSRFSLVTVPSTVISSYNDNPLASLQMGVATPDTVADLAALAAECPWLRVTDLHRRTSTQAALRKKYETWVAAGKPSPTRGGRPNPTFVAASMKAAFVALPGKSMHCGYAADLSIEAMRAALGPQYLDAFWPIAKRYGFTPVITRPLEGVAESWHFDHKGPWTVVFDHLGYDQGALAANLAMDSAASWQTVPRKLQAHIARVGLAASPVINIGEIDGIIGPRSLTAIADLGIPTSCHRAIANGDVEIMEKVIELLELR